VTPKYEIAITITVKDAGPEDILGLVGKIGDIAQRGSIVVDSETGKLLRQLTSLKHASFDEKIAAARDALKQCGGDKGRAAESLGISPVTLDSWLQKARSLEE